MFRFYCLLLTLSTLLFYSSYARPQALQDSAGVGAVAEKQSMPETDVDLEENKKNLKPPKPDLHENEPESVIRVGGYIQFWYLYEEVENSQRQMVTNDKATDEASGFCINRVRLLFSAQVGGFNALLSLMMEKGTPGLLDAWASYSFLNKTIQIWVGQMKIPSTYEVAISDDSLDFSTKSRLSSVITDWSLSTSTSSISPFTSVKSYNRDLGIALKGYLWGVHYFFMIGNGLGGNLFVGGNENKQFIYANSFGAYFYGIRLSWDIMETVNYITKKEYPLSSLSIGGHYNWNDHENVLYTDTKTVLDIKRSSWSIDGQLVFIKRIYLTVMYARGINEDDFDANKKPDYEYSGIEAKIVADIIQDWLQAGFRYDAYTSKNSIFGGEESIHAYTLGLTFMKKPYVRVQANYKFKILESELDKDLDDNIFNLQFQLKF